MYGSVVLITLLIIFLTVLRLPIYIGLHDRDIEKRDSENKFFWQSDDAPLIPNRNYSNWRSGEPNNNWGGEDEDCTQMWGTKGSIDRDFKWNDVPCHIRGHVICQKN